ncbi:hypothetical protein HYW46_05325 [Candidatus Daviesbacteria bacterium]|nr:hypothetical protein [Candidatus Daviesbacteria bacterium]
MRKPEVIAVCGGQWGDEGKGITQDEIEDRIAVARIPVEQEFGSLPVFKVKQGRFINEVPFRIDPDYRTNDWVFRFYPKWRGWEPGTNEKYLAYAFPHDLIHFYQLESYSKRLGVFRIMPKAFHLVYAQIFADWLEGAADLSTWKVIYNILNSQNDFLATNQDGLGKYFSDRLAMVLTGLKKEKLIENSSISDLGLPFYLPENMGKSANQLAEQLKMKKSDRYARGVLRSASIISKTGISLKELLQTPMSNKELKQKAGI